MKKSKNCHDFLSEAKNRDLGERLPAFYDRHEVEVRWIKGHVLEAAT